MNVEEWMEKLAKTYKLENQPKCQLLQYGSFHLQIRSPDSDIDLVLVVPKFVDQIEDFFGSLYNQFSQLKDIKDLLKVTQAYVPVIKMVYNEVKIDLVFAQTY